MSTQSADAFVVPVDGSCALPREAIGAKAWGVNRMRALAIPVPPAFVVTTGACRAYFAQGELALDRVWNDVSIHLGSLERESGRRFGGAERPLLVSVRSGAARSMPGMMDTVLDLGINDAVERALGQESRDPAYAAETHRRFREQFRRVVLRSTSASPPRDPWVQLRQAIAAVFDSWQSPRARTYRRLRGLPDDDGTAVMVQAMVFGNLDARSGTGVLFSRNPLSGERTPWGEWLAQAQGEDVVSGAVTPAPLAALRDQLPDVHTDLLRYADTLERDARDIQDIEYTVEAGRLWLLQCRVAKRSPRAALRAAVAFVDEGLITPGEALRRLDAEQVRALGSLSLSPQAEASPPLASGEPACPGVACGVAVTDPRQAETRASRGEAVVLVTTTTSPDDLHGVIASRALVTEHGGSTSHAAVVSRELGRPCVVGCGGGTAAALAGRMITVDGTTGRLWAGDLTLDGTLEASAEAADVRRLIVWGLGLVGVAILGREDAHAEIVDLDTAGERWRDALRPGITVRGQVLDTEEGIHAAVRAGVAAVVVRAKLPAILACLSIGPGETRTAPSGAAVGDAGHAVHSELSLLRLVALKGRASVAILGEALALPVEAVVRLFDPLCDAGLVLRTDDILRLGVPGRERLRTLLARERDAADPGAVREVYEAFRILDGEVKSAMTAWQVRPDGRPNDHAEQAYDDGVRRRLLDLHGRLGALAPRLVTLAPRLAEVKERLDRAAARIEAGDAGAVARVMADSYHTVWFELHEDLLSIAGLSRRDLAGPGA